MASIPSSNPPRVTHHRHGGHIPSTAQSAVDQLDDAALKSMLGGLALLHQVTGGARPERSEIQRVLTELPHLRKLPAARPTESLYTSQVATSPEATYRLFVERAGALFGRAGLKMLPAAGPLQHGGRFILEPAGVPAWMPLEARLDPARRQVTLTTLAGHPFRGTNTFRFDPSPDGGTRVVQYSEFQASSGLTTLGSKLLNIAQRQEEAWHALHAALQGM